MHRLEGKIRIRKSVSNEYTVVAMNVKASAPWF